MRKIHLSPFQAIKIRKNELWTCDLPYPVSHIPYPKLAKGLANPYLL